LPPPSPPLPSAPPRTVGQYGGLLGAAALLSVGGVLAVGTGWLVRRRCLPVARSEVRNGRGAVELVGDAAREEKRLAPADAPGVVAATAAAAIAEAQLELTSELARARKHAEGRNHAAPDSYQYAQFDFD
jgi:hypothetical protein